MHCKSKCGTYLCCQELASVFGHLVEEPPDGRTHIVRTSHLLDSHFKYCFEISTTELSRARIGWWEPVTRVKLEHEASDAIAMMTRILSQAHTSATQVVAGERLHSPTKCYGQTNALHVLVLAETEHGIDPHLLAMGKLLNELHDVAGPSLGEELAPLANEIVSILEAMQPAAIPRQPHHPKEKEVEYGEGVVKQWEAHHGFGPHACNDLRVKVEFGAMTNINEDGTYYTPPS